MESVKLGQAAQLADDRRRRFPRDFDHHDRANAAALMIPASAHRKTGDRPEFDEPVEPRLNRGARHFQDGRELGDRGAAVLPEDGEKPAVEIVEMPHSQFVIQGCANCTNICE